MIKTAIDDYLDTVPEPQHSVLAEVRKRILLVIPDAVECISYQVSCFKVDGKGIAGFAAYKNHNSYFPFSGQVFKAMPAELAGYVTTSGALHFAVDEPLGDDLIKRLIEVRLAQAF